MIPTLKDVARLANVSTATVSRCMNEPHKVSGKTREIVMAAVKELGYAPNFGGRFLASGKAGTFGAVVPTMMNAIFANVLQAFEEEITKSNSNLLVASSSYEPEIEEAQIRALVARGVDGLLLIGAFRNPELYSYLENRNTPYVVAWAYRDASDKVFVGYDNKAAMQKMVETVLSYGHRNIAMISGITAANDRALDRRAGVLAAIDGSGISDIELQVVETPYSIQDGASAMTTLMNAPTRPTAVICGNDVLAAGAVLAAREMNISVPQDVSVTGFDDNEIASISYPALTTVHFSQYDMGRASARALLSQKATNLKSDSVELETRIIVRDSLGPVRV